MPFLPRAAFFICPMVGPMGSGPRRSTSSTASPRSVSGFAKRRRRKSMSTAQQRTIDARIAVIDCFDLTPEAIDRFTFAALDADLSLEASEPAYRANDIALTSKIFARAPEAPCAGRSPAQSLGLTGFRCIRGIR